MRVMMRGGGYSHHAKHNRRRRMLLVISYVLCLDGRMAHLAFLSLPTIISHTCLLTYYLRVICLCLSVRGRVMACHEDGDCADLERIGCAGGGKVWARGHPIMVYVGVVESCVVM